MTTARLVATITLLLAGACSAQSMYRCGNTFSQNPCGPDAKEVAIKGVPQPVVQTPADPEKAEKIKAACLRWVTEVPFWKDRDSIKFSKFTVAALTQETLNGVTQTVRPYIVMVNAKNSYGGYIGEVPYVCYADPSDNKIVGHFP